MVAVSVFTFITSANPNFFFQIRTFDDSDRWSESSDCIHASQDTDKGHEIDIIVCSEEGGDFTKALSL